jgi:hypothetical protein
LYVYFESSLFKFSEEHCALIFEIIEVILSKISKVAKSIFYRFISQNSLSHRSIGENSLKRYQIDFSFKNTSPDGTLFGRRPMEALAPIQMSAQ